MCYNIIVPRGNGKRGQQYVGSGCIRALRDIGIFKGVRIMLWMVVLDDGRYFTVEATCLMAISMDLQDRGLITSDLDIISITKMVS